MSTDSKTEVSPNAVKRQGKARDRSASPAKTQNAAPSVPENLAAYYERLRSQGVRQRQAVFELHFRQGRSLTEIGDILGIKRQCVAAHWRAMQEMLAEQAPRTPLQFVMLREEIGARLRGTIEQTYGRTEVVGQDGKVTTLEAPPTPQLLAVRLRALEQMARLYGVNGELPSASAAADSCRPLPYATPTTLAEEVRLSQLELYRRRGAELVVGIDVDAAVVEGE